MSKIKYDTSLMNKYEITYLLKNKKFVRNFYSHESIVEACEKYIAMLVLKQHEYSITFKQILIIKSCQNQ